MYQKIFLSLLMIFFSQTLWADSASNIIVNGDFSTENDWKVYGEYEANWRIEDNKAIASGVDGSWSMLENNSSHLGTNRTYRITFDIIACNAFDKVGFFIQSTHPGSLQEIELYFSAMGITATGRYSVELTIYQDSYPFMLLSKGEGTTAEIDNISVVEIPPYIITPKEFLFGTVGGEKVFTITSQFGKRIPHLPYVELQGAQGGLFTIKNDSCSNQRLEPGAECSFTVEYPASTDSSISAYLNIANVTAFLHNHESTKEEAERRLPPVIDDLNISEVMDTGTDYNLTWSIIGYGDDYTTHVAFFDCNNTAEGSCGESYGSTQRFDQGLNLTPFLTEDTDWKYRGEKAKRYHYNYHFTAQTDEFGSGDTPIVIRFYYVDSKDIASGKGSISLVIPGNLSENYYDTSGRKIQKIIHKP